MDLSDAPTFGGAGGEQVDIFDRKKQSVYSNTVDLKKLIRSRPPELDKANNEAKHARARRALLGSVKKTKKATGGELMHMVKQNYELYKQVLRQKIDVEIINKGKSQIKIDAPFKVDKSFTFATSPRFAENAMFMKF